MKKTTLTVLFSILLLAGLTGCLRGRLRERIAGPTSIAPTPSEATRTPSPDPFWQEWEQALEALEDGPGSEPFVDAGELP